jgi:hypothetical protein
MGWDKFHFNLVFSITVGAASNISRAIATSIVKYGITDKICQVDELDSLGEAAHFRYGFEEVNQGHGKVKGFGFGVFDGIEEEPDEFEKVEALLFYFVDFVNGLDFVFI